MPLNIDSLKLRLQQEVPGMCPRSDTVNNLCLYAIEKFEEVAAACPDQVNPPMRTPESQLIDEALRLREKDNYVNTKLAGALVENIVKLWCSDRETQAIVAYTEAAAETQAAQAQSAAAAQLAAAQQAQEAQAQAAAAAQLAAVQQAQTRGATTLAEHDATHLQLTLELRMELAKVKAAHAKVVTEAQVVAERAEARVQMLAANDATRRQRIGELQRELASVTATLAEQETELANARKTLLERDAASLQVRAERRAALSRSLVSEIPQLSCSELANSMPTPARAPVAFARPARGTVVPDEDAAFSTPPRTDRPTKALRSE